MLAASLHHCNQSTATAGNDSNCMIWEHDAAWLYCTPLSAIVGFVTAVAADLQQCLLSSSSVHEGS